MLLLCPDQVCSLHHASPLPRLKIFPARAVINPARTDTTARTTITVLIFDNRGMGGSFLPKERENDDYDVKDMANDVVELIKVGLSTFSHSSAHTYTNIRDEPREQRIAMG